MALRTPPLTPSSSGMFDHANGLAAYLRGGDQAVEADSVVVLQNAEGVVLEMGWLRQLARDVRAAAEYLANQEPQSVDLNTPHL